MTSGQLSSRANTTADRHTQPSAAPGRSSDRARGSRDSGTPRTHSPAQTTPSGTLTQKIADQSTCSTSSPPTTGPSPNPTLPIAAQIAIARVERGPANAPARIDSDSGAIAAAPRPCTTRPATSCGSSLASAHAADPALNSASPPSNTRRRPKRSPRAPPVNSSDASTSTYALTIHARLAERTSSSARIVGNATCTIVASSITISCATHIAASVTAGRDRVDGDPIPGEAPAAFTRPRGLATNVHHAHRLEEELEVERRANAEYEAYRARGVMKDARRFGGPPKPYRSPDTPAGKITSPIWTHATSRRRAGGCRATTRRRRPTSSRS
jgi:hypothetical protein